MKKNLPAAAIRALQEAEARRNQENLKQENLKQENLKPETLKNCDKHRQASIERETRKGTTKTENRPREIKGPKGPEPTRYGDWERNGIARDF